MVFSARHFLDFGNRNAVDKALSRLVEQEGIRRLSRGIYDYPKIHPQLGVLSPSIDSVAKLVAEKNNSQLKITGAEAANALGLSTQVPARIVYLTDGPSRNCRKKSPRHGVARESISRFPARLAAEKQNACPRTGVLKVAGLNFDLDLSSSRASA